MTLSLVSRAATGLDAPSGALPPVPWRDPYSVARQDLQAYIAKLEVVCAANPGSADLRTCLGMAHAVNYDVYKCLDALEDARAIDPENFWAHLKFAEIHYRLRVLNRAEEETRRAADLAANPLQLAVARRLMKDIREAKHSSIRNVEWTKPLVRPALALAALIGVLIAVMSWR